MQLFNKGYTQKGAFQWELSEEADLKRYKPKSQIITIKPFCAK